MADYHAKHARKIVKPTKKNILDAARRGHGGRQLCPLRQPVTACRGVVTVDEKTVDQGNLPVEGCRKGTKTLELQQISMYWFFL